jgi:hypothetical protein
MALESFAQTADQVLLGNLDYKLPAGGSYIIDRRSSVFYTSAAGSFRNNGVRNFRINLTSEAAFCDLSTATLSFRLKNIAADLGLPDDKVDGGEVYRLKPKAGPHAFIYRLRVLVAGQPAEDIVHYGRVHQMMELLSPKEWKLNEGLGNFIVDRDADARNGHEIGWIANGDTVTVSMRLNTGIFQSPKFWPLRFAPISVEIELAPDIMAACEYDMANVLMHSAAGAEIRATAHYRPTWQIEDPRINVDMIQLDSELQSQYAQLMLSGKALTMHCNLIVTHAQSIVGETPVVSITRAASRIKQIMWSFTRIPGDDYNEQESEVTDFSHPHRDLLFEEGQITDVAHYEARWQLGHKLLPEHPVRTVHEAWQHLRKALGILWDKESTLDISLADYRKDRYIGVIDCEKALGVAWTGLNSRSGDLLTGLFRGMTVPALNGRAAQDNRMSQLHVCLMIDSVVEIRDSGTHVWD